MRSYTVLYKNSWWNQFHYKINSIMVYCVSTATARIRLFCVFVHYYCVQMLVKKSLEVIWQMWLQEISDKNGAKLMPWQAVRTDWPTGPNFRM